MKTIVFIGAGNLATNLAKELYKNSYKILQVYSRTLDSASFLAKQVEAKSTNEIQEIVPNADIYIFSVKDAILETLIANMPHQNGLWIHTAGSMPMRIFENKVKRFGVVYPFQTFSKNRFVDFKEIPCFIEANNPEDENNLFTVAQSITTKTHMLSSEKRKYIHLTGVFACNFVNDMYAISSKILEDQGIDYNVLLPLINETAAKVNDMTPKEAQTGPAVRYDENVMQKHIALLDDENLKTIYQTISLHIHKTNKPNE